MINNAFHNKGRNNREENKIYKLVKIGQKTAKTLKSLRTNYTNPKKTNNDVQRFSVLSIDRQYAFQQSYVPAIR